MCCHSEYILVTMYCNNFPFLYPFPISFFHTVINRFFFSQSVSNVIDTALGCERVLTSLPMVRWAQPVFDSATQLLEATTSFVAVNMSGVLASDR